MLKTNRNNKMEKETLALALACMSMFAGEYKDENDSENSKTIHNLDKIRKDIADSFPSISMPVSELSIQNRKEIQKDQTEDV